MAFGVEAAVAGEGEGAEAGDADLAAVGMAGEDEVDERAAGMGGDVVGVVGLVGHEEDGGVGGGGDGEREVGLADGEVVGAGEEEVLALALDADVLVDEQGQAVVFEMAPDDAGIDLGVVVAEDSETLGAGEGMEQLGAACGGGERDGDGHGAAGAEIAGNEDEVGGEGVDAVDDAAEEEVFGELYEVDVGELDDAEAVEGGGQVADVEGAVGGFEFVTADLVAVEGDAGEGGGGAGQEAAAGDLRHTISLSGSGELVESETMIPLGRKRRVAAAVKAAGAEAMVVTSLIDVRYLTGFTGSSAVLVLVGAKATMFTDGRYTTQAAAEVDGAAVVIVERNALGAAVAFAAKAGVSRCGFDSGQVTVAELEAMRAGLESKLRKNFSCGHAGSSWRSCAR